MLFTDSDIVNAAALLQLDAEVNLVAKATKDLLLVEGPGSICEQAWTECSNALTAAMQSYTSFLAPFGVSAGHVAAVLNVGYTAQTQSKARLQQIVSSNSQYGNTKSSLELWVAYSALAILYRYAITRKQGEDRYLEKYERYSDTAAHWWAQLRNNGLPFVWQPLEAPAAKHGFNAGSWADSNLSAVGGGTLTQPQNVRVAVTYCDTGRGYISQASKGNAESAPSSIASFTIPVGEVLRVNISSLIPPTGRPDPVGFSQGPWSPLTATHWNLWVGRDQANEPLYLQQELIPIATKQVTLSGDPSFTGSVLGNGQYPDMNLTFQNIAMRG